MIRWQTIARLTAVLAWLGLALAPFAAPVSAMAVPMETAAAQDQNGPMDMPEGMPCCPETQKPDCAKDCPFMAVCTGSLFAPVGSAVLVSAPTVHLAAFAPHDDAKRNGLAQGPPAKPPKD